MSYVIAKDYQRVINNSELDEITNKLKNGQAYADSIRIMAEGIVEATLKASLLQEFDIDAEFSNLGQFLLSNIYKGFNRVYLNAPAYDITATYAVNALTLNGGNVYRCITAITVGEAFNPAKWTLLGMQYDLFFVDYPYQLFDQNTFYVKGDIVFWKDKLYQAQKDSLPVDQQDQLQAPSLESIQYGNVTPDNRFIGAKMWGTGIPYSFTGLFVDNPLQTAWSSVTAYTTGTKVSFGGQNYVALAASTNVQPGTDWTKWATITWKAGDNRNQMFVGMYLDMVVYDLCKRIAPDNVPEARHNAWLTATANMKAIADGKINPQLPKLQPIQGNRIRFGGNPKQINTW